LSQRGLLVVVSGPSAVGKNTILSRFVNSYPNARYSISATTRKPRPGERCGRNYYFYSRDQFQALLQEGQFLEWAQVYDEYYGTPVAPILEGLERGEVIMMDLDVQGALCVRRKLPEAVLVFLLPPSLEDLKKRMYRRGTECSRSVERRLAAAKDEIASGGDYDYLIVNDDISRAVAQLTSIVEAERLRTKRQSSFLDTLEKGGTLGNC
jgi:guanylate kinase